MLTPISWLREYVTIPDLDRLVARLNQTGTTVASVQTFGEGLDGIIVGEIQGVAPHPNADKLRIATVAVPGKKLSIVCGAKNIAPGQKVPVAPVGSSVPVGPDGQHLKIAKIKIRDVESQGMLASSYELGLGDDHSGILILGDEAKIGAKITSVLSLPETVLETEVTTNRGDELSIYGLAREVAAVTGIALKTLKSPKILGGAGLLKVRVDDPKLCPRYSAVSLTDVKIAPSPAFIQSRLRQSGFRPISNVVDITNYVLLLTGQPLHAFDKNKVSGEITVRESKAGDRVTTLDGVTRQLGYGSIVIADTQKVLALGGVMGGESSSISPLTDSIILESAVFDPITTRHTVMKYGLRSEASHRFERGVDIQGTVKAMEVAVELLKKYASAKISSRVFDYYPKQYRGDLVTLSQGKLGQYLGYDLPLGEASAILGRLGFKSHSKKKGKAAFIVPPWRSRDVTIEEDLIEEVARVEGYDKIPSKLPSGVIPTYTPDPKVTQMHLIREHLTSLGLSEVLTYPMLSGTEIAEEGALKISNTISKEWEYLRVSLIPGLARSSSFNLNLSGDIQIFELGKIYQEKAGDLPYEKYALALVGEDFASVKGYFESVAEKLGIPKASFEPCSGQYLSQNAAVVKIGSSVIGTIGSLAPKYRELWSLRKSLVFGEFDIEAMIGKISETKTFRNIPKFPSIREDISLIVPIDLPMAEIIKAVKEGESKNLSNIEPFDIFADPKLGENKKSVSLALTFQSNDKTLTDAEIKGDREKIERIFKEKFHAKIR